MVDEATLNPDEGSETLDEGVTPAVTYELDELEDLDAIEDDTEEDEDGEDDAIDDDDTEDGTEEEDVAPKVAADPKNFTKRINKKHSELMAEKQRADSLQQQIDTLQKEQSVQTRPEIPPVPDPFDENFSALMGKRDLAIQSAVAFDAKQNFIDQQQKTASETKQKAEVEALQETVRTYAERAQKLGISPAQLDLAGRTVNSYGISDEVVSFILNEEKGPAVTHFLARNPAVMEHVNTLSPMAAAVYITNEVLSKMTPARKRKPVPKPADTLGGGGAPKKQRGPVGVTYT